MRLLAPIAIIILVTACQARANTITIPGDFPTLQEAFLAGVSSTTEIVLLPGEHRLTALGLDVNPINPGLFIDGRSPPALITSTDPNDPDVVASTVIVNDGYAFGSFMTLRGLTFRAGTETAIALPAYGAPRNSFTQRRPETLIVDRCVIDARGATRGLRHSAVYDTDLRINDSTVIGDAGTAIGIDTYQSIDNTKLVVDRCLIVGSQIGIYAGPFVDLGGPDNLPPSIPTSNFEINNSVLANRVADIDVRACLRPGFPNEEDCVGYGWTEFLTLTLRNTTAVAGIPNEPMKVGNGDIRFINSITGPLPDDLRPGGTIDALVDTFGFFEHDPGAAGPGYPYSTGGDASFIDEFGPDGTPGTGDEDLRLRPQSPAIDTGIGFLANTTTDFDGAPRRVDDPTMLDLWDDLGTPPASDAGAYEFQPAQPCSTADVTTINTNPGDAGYGSPDGAVDGADLSFFVEFWLAGDTAVADVTTLNTNPGDPGYGQPDGAVDGADLSYFVEQWLAGCP